jgi:hypothetical protein
VTKETNDMQKGTEFPTDVQASECYVTADIYWKCRDTDTFNSRTYPCMAPLKTLVEAETDNSC